MLYKHFVETTRHKYGVLSNDKLVSMLEEDIAIKQKCKLWFDNITVNYSLTESSVSNTNEEISDLTSDEHTFPDTNVDIETNQTVNSISKTVILNSTKVISSSMLASTIKTNKSKNSCTDLYLREVNTLNNNALSLKLLGCLMNSFNTETTTNNTNNTVINDTATTATTLKIVKPKSLDQNIAFMHALQSMEVVNDSIFVLPTGTGKSFIPLIVSMYRKLQYHQSNQHIICKTDILIIPLIALGHDLEEKYRKFKFKATFLRNNESSSTIDASFCESFDILIMTPEIFLKYCNVFQLMSNARTLGMVFFDEAHCIVTYNTIRRLYAHAATKCLDFEHSSRFLMTATFPPSMTIAMKELVSNGNLIEFRNQTNRLNIHHFRHIVMPNLKIKHMEFYKIMNRNDTKRFIIQIKNLQLKITPMHIRITTIVEVFFKCDNRLKTRILIYHSSIERAKECKKILEFFITYGYRNNNIQTIEYHSQLSEQEKLNVIKQFHDHQGPLVLCCTTAWGMGK